MPSRNNTVARIARGVHRIADERDAARRENKALRALLTKARLKVDDPALANEIDRVLRGRG